jgi:hypothetical protein
VRAGDDRAFERLLLRHWHHVRYVIKGLKVPGEDHASEWVGVRWKHGTPITLLMRAGVRSDNASQLGLVAFWLGARDFRPDCGCGFRTFASKRVKSRVFNAVRDANREKQSPVSRAPRLEVARGEDGEGDHGPLSSILIAVEGPEGMLHAVDPSGEPWRVREIKEPEERTIRRETWQEILKAATPREREAIDARLNGERLNDAERQALRRLRKKLRHVLGPNGGYISKATNFQ